MNHERDQEIKQRLALFETINRKFKKLHPGKDFQDLFPITEDSFLVIKDTPHGRGTRLIDIGRVPFKELNTEDLEEFLASGAMMSRWVQESSATSYLDKSTYILLQALSPATRVMLEEKFKQSLEESQLYPRIEAELPLSVPAPAPTPNQGEPKNNPRIDGESKKEAFKGNPGPERYPGAVELKFSPCSTVKVYDTRDRSTWTFTSELRGDVDYYRLRIYLIGGNYIMEWEGGRHIEVFPADHCRITIKP